MQIMDIKKVCDKLIGMSEKSAAKLIERHGFMCRIVSRDDEVYVCTADLEMDRINLSIRDNKVVRVFLG
jgi:hypothetical protein